MLGIFDSGIGGLTVVKELLKRHPNISFIYLGDTARMPYGNKSPELIKQYAEEDTRFLIDRGATDIVIACNTASSIALEHLQSVFPTIHFYDVISPAILATKLLFEQIHRVNKYPPLDLPLMIRGSKGDTSHSKLYHSTNPSIGIIATRATIHSNVYQQRLQIILPKAQIFNQVCPLLVPLVEEGWIDRPETMRIIRTYLAPLKQKQIQALILGCTHYPLLQSKIQRALLKKTKLIDSPSALLDHMQETAPEIFNDQSGEQKYYFTDITTQTKHIISRWLNHDIQTLAIKLQN